MKKLLPPFTLEDVLRAKADSLYDENLKLTRENSALKHQNSKLATQLFGLQKIIESVRIKWGRVGSDEAIKELVSQFKNWKNQK